MSKEELLKPRYKVVSDYPGAAQTYFHHVGDILTDDGVSAVLNQYGRAVFAVVWENYPLIYKKMVWHDRSIDELPMYLSTDIFTEKPGFTFKVDTWKKEGDKVGLAISQELKTAESEVSHIAAWYCTPATEQEYNNYKNQHP